MDIVTETMTAEVMTPGRDYDTGTGIVISTNGYRPHKLEVMSYDEIVVMFRISKHTAYAWKAREVLPKPDDVITGRELWRPETMILWGRHTGRKVYLHPDTANRYLAKDVA